MTLVEPLWLDWGPRSVLCDHAGTSRQGWGLGGLTRTYVNGLPCSKFRTERGGYSCEVSNFPMVTLCLFEITGGSVCGLSLVPSNADAETWHLPHKARNHRRHVGDCLHGHR